MFSVDYPVGKSGLTLIFVLKLVELLPEGLLVDAGHSELYRLLGFDSHYGGKYGETL